MKRRRTVRVLKWVCAGGCLCTAIPFILSGWVRFEYFWHRPADCVFLTIDHGFFTLSETNSPYQVNYLRSIVPSGWHAQAHLDGWSSFNSLTSFPSRIVTTVYQAIRIPFWCPFVLFAVTLTFLVWLGSRRVALNLCPQCDYDLTGNISGVCPECGLAVQVLATAVTRAAFLRRRRAVVRRRRFRKWMQRFASVRKWGYTIGAGLMALVWVLSYFCVVEFVGLEGDLATEHALSVLTVSVANGQLEAVIDALSTVEGGEKPDALPTAGLHLRRAGLTQALPPREIRTSSDRSVSHSTYDLVGFHMWIPFVVLLIPALLRWRRERRARQRSVSRVVPSPLRT